MISSRLIEFIMVNRIFRLCPTDYQFHLTGKGEVFVSIADILSVQTFHKFISVWTTRRQSFYRWLYSADDLPEVV